MHLWDDIIECLVPLLRTIHTGCNYGSLDIDKTARYLEGPQVCQRRIPFSEQCTLWIAIDIMDGWEHLNSMVILPRLVRVYRWTKGKTILFRILRREESEKRMCSSSFFLQGSYLVDPASSHMLVSKIKPCMSKYKRLYSETADGSINQL